MLARILATIADAGRPLCLAELRGALGIDEAALEGMLETLAARGRLFTNRFDDVGCGGCPVRSGCFIMDDGVAVTYALAEEASAGAAGAGARRDEATIAAA